MSPYPYRPGPITGKPSPLGAYAMQTVLIQCDETGLDRYYLLGEGSIEATAGFGGWQAVERPDNISFTEWPGQEPVKVSVPLLLDGMSDGDGGQDGNLAALMKLGRYRRGHAEPPTFQLFGAYPFEHLTWVMESIEMGDSVRHPNTGSLQRQALTLNLMEYVDPDTIRFKKLKRKKKARTVRAKQGDTMVKMAVRFYKNRKKWKLIRKANPKLPKDPRKKIKRGTKVKIPPG